MASADMIREAQDPATTGARLAELAQADRGLWTSIAVHPSAYPALLDWLGEQGDPTVDAVLALRSGSPAAASSPAGPPPPPAETPAAPASHVSAPPASTTNPPAAGSTGNDSKSLWVVCGVVVVVLALIGGAAFGATKVFGGDDDKPTVTSGDTKTTDAPEPDESDDPTPTMPTAPSVPTFPTPDTGGSKPAGAFCSELTDIQKKSMDVLGGGSSDPSQLQDTARGLVQSYQDLEKIAPAEVKGDIGIMSSFLSAMMDPSSGKSGSGMDEYIQAAQRIGVYYAQNCL